MVLKSQCNMILYVEMMKNCQQSLLHHLWFCLFFYILHFSPHIRIMIITQLLVDIVIKKNSFFLEYNNLVHVQFFLLGLVSEDYPNDFYFVYLRFYLTYYPYQVQNFYQLNFGILLFWVINKIIMRHNKYLEFLHITYVNWKGDKGH